MIEKVSLQVCEFYGAFIEKEFENKQNHSVDLPRS